MTTRQWDDIADAVIIGSGGGALCAALALRRAGLSPLVLEKEDQFGGSTAMSGGMIWLPNHPHQQKAGVHDSFDEAMNYLDALVGEPGPGASMPRKRAYVETSPQIVEFLAENGVGLKRCEGWSDYHDELPGGCRESRSVAVAPFDARRLRTWEPRLRRGPMPLPIVGSELRNLPLVKRTFGAKLLAARFAVRMLRSRIFGSKLVGMGAALQGRLMEALLRAGGSIELNAPVLELVIEEGEVTGVIARMGGKNVAIRAVHGVLIAAGGFAKSDELRQRFLPKPTTTDWSNANPGDTGDMLLAAERLGAATDMLDQAVWVAGSRPPGSSRPALHSAGDLGKPHLIVVDRQGRRFVNEAGSYMATGQAMYAANAVPCWAIMDSRNRRKYFWAGSAPGKIPQAWLDGGYIRAGDTIEELAGKCGLDPESLRGTVERWNGFAEKGADLDFHRGERGYDRWFGDPSNRPNPTLGTIEQPPFYAVEIFPGDVGTYGGIVADEQARVLREDGAIIPGLYACGNVTASVFGRAYPGAGASIGASFVFGFLAAQDMIRHKGNGGKELSGSMGKGGRAGRGGSPNELGH